MPKRSGKRDTAKAAYIARKSKGEIVNLRELAEQQGVSYQTLRNWKTADKWDANIPKPKRKRGGQPGNRNSAGHQNAAGSHNGAPPGNKNAEKDGAYSNVFFDMLTDHERAIAEQAPTGSRDALVQEMQLLKVREHRIMSKIAEYEAVPENTLYLSSLLDMREPAGKGENVRDGARQQLGMYTKDSAFNRILKLQEALYKVQGRIATITNSLRAMEEADQRLALERERLNILRMRVTGAVPVDEPDTAESSDYNPPTESEETI